MNHMHWLAFCVPRKQYFELWSYSWLFIFFSAGDQDEVCRDVVDWHKYTIGRTASYISLHFSVYRCQILLGYISKSTKSGYRVWMRNANALAMEMRCSHMSTTAHTHTQCIVNKNIMKSLDVHVDSASQYSVIETSHFNSENLRVVPTHGP